MLQPSGRRDPADVHLEISLPVERSKRGSCKNTFSFFSFSFDEGRLQRNKRKKTKRSMFSICKCLSGRRWSWGRPACCSSVLVVLRGNKLKIIKGGGGRNDPPDECSMSGQILRTACQTLYNSRGQQSRQWGYSQQWGEKQLLFKCTVKHWNKKEKKKKEGNSRILKIIRFNFRRFFLSCLSSSLAMLQLYKKFKMIP